MTRSLAVAMIVRDEERVLARCLDSIAGIHDQLIIVDTGSRDRTLEIAESYGARIVRYAGANGPDGRIRDFSDARNVALGLAACDWVLQIDADEVLICAPDAIGKITSKSTADAVSVRLRSEGSEWQSVRIFRRHAAHRYVGKIHEYLEFDGVTETRADIVMENLPDKAGKESAYERNVRIGRSEIESGEGSSRVWHNLGNEHFREGAWAEAARCYGISLDLGGYSIGRFHGSFYKASCHLVLGEVDDAIHEARRSIAINRNFAEAHCLLGDCLFIQDKFAEARESYLAAIACKERRPPSPFPTQPWMQEDHPRTQVDLIARLL